jgi:NADH-quinone oxidoreductase subunit M
VAVVIAIVGVVLTALYILLAYQKIFTGPVREGLEKTPDLSWREKLVTGPLIVAMVVLGFIPGIAIGVLRDPVADAITTAVPAASPAEVSE